MYTPDEEYRTADLTSFAGPTLPINGRYTVKEAYLEVKVPIIQDRPWAQLLSVNGSYRYSDYSTNHTTDTYGIGAEWAPVKEVRLRGSYQQAVRAANIIELFLGQGLNLFNMSQDPCGTSPEGAPPTATLAQCLLTGLKPAQYGSALLTNPAGQYNYLQGGNVNLSPENPHYKRGGVKRLLAAERIALNPEGDRRCVVVGHPESPQAQAFRKVAEEVARQVSIEAMKPELVVLKKSQ